jgi:hypothetical protein
VLPALNQPAHPPGVLIGAGSFGRVYKGRWQGRDVAVKVMFWTAFGFVSITDRPRSSVPSTSHPSNQPTNQLPPTHPPTHPR